VAGFHIEYTGMKFGMFYAGELLHALTFGALFSALFLGGWRGPGAEAFPLLGVVYFLIKSFILYFVIMWVKYSLPRIRIDHMLSFCWKFLTPLSLALVIVTAILAKVLQDASTLVVVLAFTLANILLVAGTIFVLNRFASKGRQRVAEPRPVAISPENRVSEIP